MLIEFRVENFKSIKEEVMLSLLATKDSSLEENTIKTDIMTKAALLRTAVIYGANASGKSNLLQALVFLKALVTKSHTHQKGTKIRFSPFKLDKEFLSKPTKFRVTFIKNDMKYVYGISFNEDKVIDEYLYYYPSNRKRAIIFERKNTTQFVFTTDKSIQTFISQRTLENVLYLSKATQEKYEKTVDAFEWFKDTLQSIGPADHPVLTNFTVKLLNEPNMKEVIVKALHEADLGIKDISTSNRKLKMEELPAEFPDELKKLLVQEEHLEIKMLHKITNDKKNSLIDAYLDFSEESEGTQRFFSLIGPFIDALSKGMVLVVDELEAKLHSSLNVFLVKLFHNISQNKKNAQLIFTTHNVELMEEDIFRRDQIWFTEKNPDTGSTDLYSLVNFSPRKDKNIKKGYLAGRYGALPFIKEGIIFK
jgi:hypothetical protein